MAEKSLRRAVVLAKIEAAYGTDSAPGVSNGILSAVPSLDITGDQNERDVIRATLSPEGFVVGTRRQQIKIETELKGINDSDAPEEATHLDCLFRACGLLSYPVLVLPVSAITNFAVGDVVTGGTSNATGTITRVETGKLHLKSYTGTFQASETVTNTGTGTATVGTSPTADKRREYLPHSDFSAMESCTIYYYLDGIKHALVGCRGTVSIEFPVGNYPKAAFTMTGFYAAPADATNPSDVVFEEHLPPSCLAAGLRIGSYAPTGIQKIDIDLGNTISEKKDVQSETGLSAVNITDRKGKCTIDLDVDTLANFNPFALFSNGTKQAISWKAGSTVGNRVFVCVPAAQMEVPKYGDRDKMAIYNLTFTMTGDDDECAIQIG